MRTNSPAERIALKRPNKPIKYWEAFKGGQIVDQNNSIALLRFKWQGDKSILFKAVR